MIITAGNENVTTVRNAGRYWDMCNILDQIDGDIIGRENRKPYRILYNYLYNNDKLNTKVVPTITGAYQHRICAFGKGTKDNRRDIPAELINVIVQLSKSKDFDIDDYPWVQDVLGKKKNAKKIPITWMVCYVHKIPIKAKVNKFPEGWENWECSHRCAEYGIPEDTQFKWHCIDPLCMLWESKSKNQSRGNPMCRSICSHPGCESGLCNCMCTNGFNKWHDPPCW